MGRRRQATLTDTPTARLGDVLSRTRARRVQSPARSIEADQFPEYPANSGGSRVPVGVLSYRANIADGEVIETHQETNSTSSRVLSKVDNNAPGNDAARAVAAEHQKDNSTNTRILASLDHDATPLGVANTTNDASRAVGGPAVKTLTLEHYHQRDNSTTSRVLESHATDDALRAVGTDHQKDNSTNSRVLASRAGGADPLLEPLRAVGTEHQKSNSTTERVLASRAHTATPLDATNAALDAERATGPDHIKTLALDHYHQKDNSTNERVLKSVNNNQAGQNASRAVDSFHQKDNSTNERILLSAPNDATGNDANRAVSHEHQKDNSTNARVLASATAEENNLNRAVMEDHIRQNSIKTSFGPAGDTIHSKVAQDAIGRRELLSHPTDDGRRGVGPDHIRDETMDRRHFRTRNIAGFNGLKSLPENVKVDGEEIHGRINTNAYLQEDNFRRNGVVQAVVPPGALMSGISVSKISFINDAGRYLEEVPPQAIKPGLDGSKLDNRSVGIGKLYKPRGGHYGFPKNSIGWDSVDVEGVVFTARLNAAISGLRTDLKTYVDNNFSREGHTHGP